MLTLSRLSTEYVQIQVTFTIAGAPQNPTGDAVSMAFMDSGAIPVSGDWHAASWETAGTSYFAQCLVGPGGVVLPPGAYVCWLKIQDNPEVPVRAPAQLTIT